MVKIGWYMILQKNVRILLRYKRSHYDVFESLYSLRENIVKCKKRTGNPYLRAQMDLIDVQSSRNDFRHIINYLGYLMKFYDFCFCSKRPGEIAFNKMETVDLSKFQIVLPLTWMYI